MAANIYTDVKLLLKYTSEKLEIDFFRVSVKTLLTRPGRFRQYDVIVLNSLRGITFAFLFYRLFGLIRSRIIVLDPIFVKPEGFKQRLFALVKGFLLNRAEALLIYAKNNEGVRKYFRIKHEKMHYVPFKVNGLDLIVKKFSDKQSDGYVFSGGRSRRDYATLISAASVLPDIPFKIVCPPEAELLRENCTIYKGPLPGNVEIINDNGTLGEFLEVMSHSEVVVLPTTVDNIAPAGISVYLNAMALKRPVIISRGPAVDGVLTADQAIMVEAENVSALKNAIEQLFCDTDRKQELARNGYDYAMSLGDESELFNSVEKYLVSLL